MSTILLVEDNPHIMKINSSCLSMEDYSVLEAADAAQCRYMLSNNDVDLVILDIMLPDGDGISLCREIKAKYDIPILFLSALSENDDIITALRAGGDDYLPKPYDIQVLIARVELGFAPYGKTSVISRSEGSDLIRFQWRHILPTTTCSLPERVLDTAYACRNIGSTVPKAELYENVWGLPYSDNANALFTAVSRLNKKLDDNKADVTITYERGKGYALESI
ncbi:MAG: response regulator transcription factor [[Eubacterium] siraeum]